ncbi:MAG: TIGR04053 family radical SAM/SPASM domain-containing protein [Elusimicrobia bacterium]|nr:TIGR04053 family radical SAM/SPASM domain-containing protein [Elusimicrobiota bacterium]
MNPHPAGPIGSAEQFHEEARRARARGAAFKGLDYDKAPLLVIWETTRSCALACKHCRASAILGRDPEELSTGEGFRLLDQAAAMGTPLFILTGGDPLQRDDLEELVRHGKERGLRIGTIPAATERLTRARLASLKEAGVDQVALSLDAPEAAPHDGFRGVEGSFAKVMEAAGWARELGIPLQINTCFAAWNFSRLDEMIRTVKGLGVVFWEVFFLVPTGRGAAMDGLCAAQFEEAFAKLYALSREVSFVVKLTEAQHYRRYVLQEEARARAQGRAEEGRRPMGSSAPAVNAGKGYMFVDYRGDAYPSGFLPVPVGSVRRQGLAELYRDAPLMRELRDSSKLKGKCGDCEYRVVCSGSRARAYALTGDPQAEEEACAYEPAAHGRNVA